MMALGQKGRGEFGTGIVGIGKVVAGLGIREQLIFDYITAR